MTIEIKEGKDLLKEEIDLINKYRKKELGSKSEIIINSNNENWNKKFFLVRDNNQIVAFGRLHDVNIEFKNRRHSVLGIASIVALKKGEGYGKSLINEMISYAQKNNKAILGFCAPTVSGFYEKSGLSIIKGNDRFIYKDANGDLHQKDDKSDVMYFKGNDYWLEEILDNPVEVVYIKRNFW